MEGEYVILAMCSWFRIRHIENTVYFTSFKLWRENIIIGDV